MGATSDSCYNSGREVPAFACGGHPRLSVSHWNDTKKETNGKEFQEVKQNKGFRAVEGQSNEGRLQWLSVFLSGIQLSAIVTSKNKWCRKRKNNYREDNI